MELSLQHKTFLICGASSGFGRAIAEHLLVEKAKVILVARRADLLASIKAKFPKQVQYLVGDLTNAHVIDEILKMVGKTKLQGAVINGGGPKALTALETNIDDWDEAYRLVVRWKIDLSLKLIPLLEQTTNGRILFVESMSIKQPVPALVLSNSFRAAIAGFAKTLSQEVAKKGLTVNILAPGSHETPAIERVIQKRSEQTNQPYRQVKEQMEADIPVGRMGKASEIASLACWLLSPMASFVTGQVISHDGGKTNGIFG